MLSLNSTQPSNTPVINNKTTVTMTDDTSLKDIIKNKRKKEGNKKL